MGKRKLQVKKTKGTQAGKRKTTVPADLAEQIAVGITAGISGAILAGIEYLEGKGKVEEFGLFAPTPTSPPPPLTEEQWTKGHLEMLQTVALPAMMAEGLEGYRDIIGISVHDRPLPANSVLEIIVKVNDRTVLVFDATAQTDPGRITVPRIRLGVNDAVTFAAQLNGAPVPQDTIAVSIIVAAPVIEKTP